MTTPTPPATTPSPDQIYGHTKVSAEFDHTCFLACVESLTRDGGQAITQLDIIAKLSPQLVHWKTQPGLVADGSEIPKILVASSLNGPAKSVKTQADVLRLFDKAKGGFVFTHKFYDPNNPANLAIFNHSLRLLDADRSGIVIMNPIRKPHPAEIKFYPWSEFDRWEVQGVLLFT